MALFGKRKETNEVLEERKPTETKSSSCCCGGGCDCESMEAAETAKTEGASVKVLGSGCAKCNQLEAATKEALAQMGMDTAIEHVTDFAEIAKYGVMLTPGLVIDEKVVAYGKVLKPQDIAKIIEKAK